MSTKIQPITMEDTIQTTIPTTSSTSSTISPKVSLFSKKSGFVIPKNKLSGSLVPIFRASKKPGGADVANEETTKQLPRKTKWGPDLTQDSFVKKGRASAYQTRLEQITRQLNSGIMDANDDHDSANKQSVEKLELLELERREVIGEILKLNPSYKAPPDYKPLLNEDKVVIPIKEYPERNFIEVIFAGDTLKRLEKETGAKMRVYGTKADTMKESEIISYDGNETDYEELSVNVTAESYEKVDAAVSLIELLMKPVSANTVPEPVSEDPPISPVNQTPPLPQFPHYPKQWLPTPQFPNLSVSTPPFSDLSVSTPSFSNMSISNLNSAPIQSQPPPPLHRPPNMNYVGPPRNPLPPVQNLPRQQNFSAPNMQPMGPAIPRPLTATGWSQPPAVPQMIRPPPPPPPVRSLPPPSIRLQPPITAIRPQPPISNDFTFQTHRQQPPPSQPPPRQGSQFMPPPQPPSFRPGPPPMMQQGFHNHQMGPPIMAGPPDRRPVFSGHGPPPPAARQFVSPGGPFPPRPGNFGQVSQNHHPSMGFRPQNFVAPNQQLRGNVAYSLGRPGHQSVPRQQIYDPFSPSAQSRKPGNTQNLRKQESDPEYDDLMASVGVK